VYCNGDWQPQQGGALRLWPPKQPLPPHAHAHMHVHGRSPAGSEAGTDRSEPNESGSSLRSFVTPSISSSLVAEATGSAAGHDADGGSLDGSAAAAADALTDAAPPAFGPAAPGLSALHDAAGLAALGGTASGAMPAAAAARECGDGDGAHVDIAPLAGRLVLFLAGVAYQLAKSTEDVSILLHVRTPASAVSLFCCCKLRRRDGWPCIPCVTAALADAKMP
jgi:hypothetical protein